MKINDKVIVAFLVSVGVFTTMQAKEYVSNLSKKEKSKLISVKELRDKNIVLCENVTDPGTVSADNKKSS